MKKRKLIRFVILLFCTILLLCISGIATYKIMESRSFQFFGGLITRINTEEKVVALTFDDGPSQNADEILSILSSQDVKATFFVIGSEIEKYPEDIKKLILAGHEIGNHTYSHDRMVFHTLTYIKNEIEKTDNLIKEMGYNEPIQFRPPYGKKLFLLPYYLYQHDKKTILWDLEPNSYPEINSSTDGIVQYVVDNAKPGSIILLHPWYNNSGNTVDAIKGIIEGLRSKGYEFITINELMNYNIN